MTDTSRLDARRAPRSAGGPFARAAGWQRERVYAEQTGITLLELLVSMGVLVMVSSTVFNGIFRITKVNAVVGNRSEMHAGVRNATELLQQEVGQAGRIALPLPGTLSTAVTAGNATVGI